MSIFKVGKKYVLRKGKDKTYGRNGGMGIFPEQIVECKLIEGKKYLKAGYHLRRPLLDFSYSSVRKFNRKDFKEIK